MKAIKETVRKYYKYVPWTQPVFTSDTTWGSVTADNYATGYSQYPYQALDGKTSGGDGSDFASSGGTTVNWYWGFAEPLQVTHIKLWNRNNAGSYGGATTYTIYGLNSDLTTYTQIGSISLSATGWATGETDVTAGYYYGLKIYCSGSKSYVGIGEILLTAFTRTTDGAWAGDYDYYTDTDVYKLIKANNTYYGVR